MGHCQANQYIRRPSQSFMALSVSIGFMLMVIPAPSMGEIVFGEQSFDQFAEQRLVERSATTDPSASGGSDGLNSQSDSDIRGDNITYAAMSYGKELEVRNALLQQVARQGGAMKDPPLNAYIQQLGDRLSVSEQPKIPFRLFWVEDHMVNAVAMPGSVIGINTGLLNATESESEVAGVIAHEMAHVLERHIARRFEQQAQNATARSATLIASAALAALTGAPGQAALMGAMGSQAQARIDITREYEEEADREATQLLRGAGYDTRGMASFFVKLQRRNYTGSEVPNFLRTHPLPMTRASDIAAGPQNGRLSSQTYELAKIRVNGLTNYRCHEQIVQQGYSYPLSADYASYWRDRCLGGNASMSQARASEHWMLAYDYADDLIKQNESAQAKQFIQQSLNKWPQNSALISIYIKAAKQFGWPLSALQTNVLRQIDQGEVMAPAMYRAYADVARRSGDEARAEAAYGYYAWYTGRVEDAMIKFRSAMEHAANVGAEKQSWTSAIGQLHQRYGL